MYKNKKFIGLIPARGGSKGIPRKNIVPVAGKPLIQYTIDAALGSRCLDAVVVSTDCPEIAAVAEKCGARVPFLRPPELSSDEAKTIDAVLHAINELSVVGDNYDAVVVLQPTQPLRTSVHIDEAIKLFAESGCESVVGVCPVEEHPFLMRTIDENRRLVPVINQNSTIRRQDLCDVYKVNGLIYINSIKDINSDTSLNDNLIPYVMDRDVSLDIDTFSDLIVAEERL